LERRRAQSAQLDQTDGEKPVEPTHCWRCGHLALWRLYWFSHFSSPSRRQTRETPIGTGGLGVPRTPNTFVGIFSAGENIRDGYVSGQQDLKFCGTILTSHARRLIELVDRILLFASTRAGSKKYSITRVAVPEILTAVRNNMKDVIAEEGYTLEENIDSKLA
jgi:hypothetical protein